MVAAAAAAAAGAGAAAAAEEVEAEEDLEVVAVEYAALTSRQAGSGPLQLAQRSRCRA